VFRLGDRRGALVGLWQHSGFLKTVKGEASVKKILVKAVAVLGLCLCLNGCIPTAVAVYAVSRHRTHKTYQNYVDNMGKTNQERQQQGLEPLPIASFKDWKKEGKPSGKSEGGEAPAPATGK
jgi:hypothetical protein